MASIKKRDTRPELALRSALWRAGVRGWRCHFNVTGTPDIAFTRWKLAVFVDGVWWHGHPDFLPNGRRGPYWDEKIARNVVRDRQVNEALAASGWRVLRLWDIDILRQPEAAAAIVSAALTRLQSPRTTSGLHGDATPRRTDSRRSGGTEASCPGEQVSP